MLRQIAVVATLIALDVLAAIVAVLKWTVLWLPGPLGAAMAVLIRRRRVERALFCGDEKRGPAKAGRVHGIRRGGLSTFHAVPYATAQRFRHAALHTDCNDSAFKTAYPRPWFAPPWWPQDLVNANPAAWAPIAGSVVMALTEQPMSFGIVRLLASKITGGPACRWGDEARALQLTIHQPHATRAAGPHVDKKRPVLVFIHGGAFVTMSSYMPLHRCEQLAATTGCVVVSIEYRQGILGFAGFDDPRAGCDANCGLTDCETALRWVRRYIHNFDGDAGRVTIMGQSAGSMLCSSLAAMPRCRDLFRNIILLSGASSFPVSRADARATLKRFAVNAGVADPDDHVALAEALRQMPLNQLMALQKSAVEGFERDSRECPEDLRGQARCFGPVIEPTVLPQHIFATFKDDPSLLRDRTVVVSSTTSEYALFVLLGGLTKSATPIDDSQTRRRIRHLFDLRDWADDDARIDRIIDAYESTRRGGWEKHTTNEKAGVYIEAYSDAYYRLPSEAFADKVAEAGGRAVVCRFAEPALFPRGIQATHAVDLHYWLGNRLVPPFWAGALPTGRHARRFAQVSGAMMELVGDVCWGRHVAAPAWRRRSEGPRGPVTVFGDAGGASRPEQAPVCRVAETCEAACAGDDARTAVWGDLHAALPARHTE